MLLDITASSELRYLEEHLLWCARLATESHECFYIANGISESCLLSRIKMWRETVKPLASISVIQRRSILKRVFTHW